MTMTTTTRTYRAEQQLDLLRILITYVSFIGIGVNSVLLNLAWTPMRAQFQQPLEAVGVLLFASTIGYLVSSFLTGSIAGRIGMGLTAFIGAATAAAGLLLTAFAGSWHILLPCFTLAGFGSGLIDGGFNAYFAEHHSKRTLNWLHASFGIGATIGPAMVTAILAGQGAWQSAYVVAAALLGAIALIFFFMRGQWKTMAAQTQRTDGGSPTGVRTALRLPAVWLGMLLFFMYGGMEYAPGQWTSTLFTQVRGIELEVAGLWVSIYWGTFTFGRIVFGAFINFLPVRPLIRICLLGALIGTGLVWWNPIEWASFFGLALIGFCAAPMFPVFISQTPEWVGVRNASNAIGFQVASASLGIAVIPAVIGLAASSISLAIIPAFFFGAAVIVTVVYEIMLRQRAP
jgi:fucose permease